METYGLEKLGITNTGKIYRNLDVSRLVEESLKRGEGILMNTGALAVTTGKYTGRSPKDKFIVDTPDIHDQIAWGSVNVPISDDKYQNIKNKMFAYLQQKDLFVFDGFAGADEKYTRKFRIINELACQNLFIHQLLIRPTAEQLEDFGDADFTLVVAPDFHCVPEVDGTNSEAAIIVNFSEKLVLIAGSRYSGEIKKSVFSVMNYLMPVEENVLPMHCSANMDPETHETAVFFGLSGTGKTTLSADPARKLIGDDEHGWSEDGVFNFEGGCYAKCINLSAENEPDIYNAIRFGSQVENVVVDPETRIPDYDDDSLTENTRVGYPIDYINNAQIPGKGGVSQGCDLPHRRRLRRAPAHLQTGRECGHVPLRNRIHLQAGRNGAGHPGAAAHLLHPVRRALHASGSVRLREDAGRQDREVRHQGVPGEHRMVRRPLRSGKPHEALLHQSHDHRRLKRHL